MIKYKDFEYISRKLRNDLQKEYPLNTVSMGDNGLVLGFWINTQPGRTFVPLKTKDNKLVFTDYTTK